VQVLGVSCLYFWCDGSAGTLPKIDLIKIRPINIFR
jgi:hypothetical protein